MIHQETHETAAVGSTLSALADLPRADLVTQWEAAYGAPPPKGMSRRFLVLVAAYHLQTKRQGGLANAAARELAKRAAAPQSTKAKSRPVVRAGARLVREWNGVTHVVDVVADGFIWNGARYRSLSAIARAITGARWSGPRFFGL